jgi:hypothetical protein
MDININYPNTLLDTLLPCLTGMLLSHQGSGIYENQIGRRVEYREENQTNTAPLHYRPASRNRNLRDRKGR